jgi:hypothetical protein
MNFETPVPGALDAHLDRILKRLAEASDLGDFLPEILDAAIGAAAADMGNIQVLDHGSGALKIVFSRGFGAPFLDFFASVSAHNNSACGAALINRTRVMVEDVTTNYLFVGTPALDVMLTAGARAVHSTPAVSQSGRLMGVLSTQWRRPVPGMPYDPARVDCLALHLADRLEELENKSRTSDGDGT